MKTPEMLTRMVEMLEFAYRHPDCPTKFTASDWPVFTKWVADHKNDPSPIVQAERIQALEQENDELKRHWDYVRADLAAMIQRSQKAAAAEWHR